MKQDTYMLNKIYQTLGQAIEGFSLLNDDFFIIGSSALLLSGIDIGVTHDIDILTSIDDSERLKGLWKERRVDMPFLKEEGLFTSDFAQYEFDELTVEILGELKVCKEGEWIPVVVDYYQICTINNFDFKMPTLQEQVRILNLFGREKDKKRLEQIKMSKKY